MARDRVNWVLEVEHEATFTLNSLYYLSYRRNFEAFYKSLRFRRLCPPGHREGKIVRRVPALEMPAWFVEDQQKPAEGVDTCATEELRIKGECSPNYASQVSCIYRESEAVRETDDLRRTQLIDQLESGYPTDIPELIGLIPAKGSDHAIEILADVRAYWQGTFKQYPTCFPDLLICPLRSCFQTLRRLYPTGHRHGIRSRVQERSQWLAFPGTGRFGSRCR